MLVQICPEKLDRILAHFRDEHADFSDRILAKPLLDADIFAERLG